MRVNGPTSKNQIVQQFNTVCSYYWQIILVQMLLLILFSNYTLIGPNTVYINGRCVFASRKAWWVGSICSKKEQTFVFRSVVWNSGNDRFTVFLVSFSQIENGLRLSKSIFIFSYHARNAKKRVATSYSRILIFILSMKNELTVGTRTVAPLVFHFSFCRMKFGKRLYVTVFLFSFNFLFSYYARETKNDLLPLITVFQFSYTVWKTK
jgi:hypothetical protein